MARSASWLQLSLKLLMHDVVSLAGTSQQGKPHLPQTWYVCKVCVKGSEVGYVAHLESNVAC